MAEATHLGNLFKLFSIAFTPHTAQSVKVLTNGMLASDIATTWKALDLPQEALDVFLEALASYKDRNEKDVLHELRQDWTYMYMGDPPRISNNEGMWRFHAEGRETVRMINRHARAVSEFMRECGVVRQEKYNDCIDYLENECDFCAFLANGPEYLVEMGKDHLELLSTFMDDHVLQWAPGFCKDIQLEARTPYYQAIAVLMEVFLREF